MNKIIVIGNYPLDKQESMLRFAGMLQNGFHKQGYKVVYWSPIVFFAFFCKSSNSGLGKWLGYVDKWLLYPIILWFRVLLINDKKQNIRFHICDHSNAPYQQFLPTDLTSITCHDVLAIQGALGYPNTYCQATSMGVYLQKWILKHLQCINKIATVSQYTLTQLNELTLKFRNNNNQWKVIHNAFNESFYPLDKEIAMNILKNIDASLTLPYLLHVGSDLPRKNRKLLIDMLILLGNSWNGSVCFAGQSLDQDLKTYIIHHNLEHRVVSVVNPSHQTLLALYSQSEALIFPSFSEGFGWPIIEAQACRIPVITSELDPMPEVSGNVAIYANPYNAQSFADAFEKLLHLDNREWYIIQGEKNSRKYHIDIMIEKYKELMQLK